MSEPTRGLLDTSVIIDHDTIDVDALPDESAICAISIAELAAGPNATDDALERARRLERLQWAASVWNPLPFDEVSARMYGRVFAAVRTGGRTARSRFADLLIAAVAAANDLPLYTRNATDFTGLGDLITVVAV
ncbi:MAG: type II toxin-antitoxin system VapC family toxin [Spirochaetaceae bacterium]